MMQQPWIQAPQHRGPPKYDIAGPFALVRRPVVAGLIRTEQNFLDGVQLPGHFLQQARPVHSQLLIQQLLRPAPVLHPGKTVALPHKLQARGLHLLPQPRPPVQADLDGERKPSLNSSVHETPARMLPVVVQKQAFAPARHQLQLPRLPVAIHLESLARFDATQHTEQPLVHALFGSHPPRHLFLLHATRSQVLHRPPQRASLSQRSILQSLTDVLCVATEIFQQNLVHGQIRLHPRHVRQRSQRPSKNQPVEPRQHSRDLVSMVCDKLFHGASLLPRCSVLAEPPHLIENRSAFHFWLRLRRAVQLHVTSAASASYIVVDGGAQTTFTENAKDFADVVVGPAGGNLDAMTYY